MVTKVLRFLFYTIFTFCYASANAYDFVSNGIYYNILSAEEATVEITSEYGENAESTYSGFVNIPQIVYDNFSRTFYTVVGVGKWAFCQSQLEGISLPSSIIRIEEWAFQSCKGISSFVIPENIEYIGDYAFYDSDLAANLFIPKSCKYIGSSSFANTNITELTIEQDFFTPSIKLLIKGGAFSYCKNLSYVNLSYLHYDFAGNPFFGCSNLNTIEGSGQYTDYPNYNSKGNLLIDGCLYKFEESNNIRHLELICCPGGMNSYTSPNSYTGIENKKHVLTSLGSGAFAGCTSITFLDIPNTVNIINENALFIPLGETSPDHDYIYRKVIIPESVEEIGRDVFGWWGRNWDIYLYSTHITDIHSSSASDEERKFGTIHIPYGTLSSFGTEWTRRAFDIVDDIFNVTANQGDTGDYWATFYSNISHYKVSSGTKVFKVNLTGTTLTMSEITDGIITKEQGVVLKASSASITLTPNASASADDYSGNSLVGTMTSITNPGNAYVLNYKAATGAGFYKLKDDGTIGANKAYLVYNGPAFVRGYFGFDETTGIKMPIVEDYDDADAVVYDLQGRRVQNPAKGLYIVNGKKVIIK